MVFQIIYLQDICQSRTLLWNLWELLFLLRPAVLAAYPGFFFSGVSDVRRAADVPVSSVPASVLSLGAEVRELKIATESFLKCRIRNLKRPSGMTPMAVLGISLRREVTK